VKVGNWRGITSGKAYGLSLSKSGTDHTNSIDILYYTCSQISNRMEI